MSELHANVTNLSLLMTELKNTQTKMANQQDAFKEKVESDIKDAREFILRAKDWYTKDIRSWRYLYTSFFFFNLFITSFCTLMIIESTFHSDSPIRDRIVLTIRFLIFANGVVFVWVMCSVLRYFGCC